LFYEIKDTKRNHLLGIIADIHLKYYSEWFINNNETELID